MTRLKKRHHWLLTTGILLSILSVNLYSQEEGESEDIFELSPFTVEGSDYEGYLATTTLAGSRLNTQIRDVGAAISIVTPEFFEDTGATDAETTLQYMLNMDVGGSQGNFSGSNQEAGGRVTTQNSRINPQGSQRVRGLASAELTRNFFQTDIPFDTYNTDRVTVNRGPNSLLFGIGSPGGVLDNSTKQALLSSDNAEVSVRFGERGSIRGTLDVNRPLIEDRLAVRFAAMYDEMNYQQEPAFDKEERAYIALKGVVFENDKSNFLDRTVVRINGERGSIESNPVNIIPPGDAISSWFEAPTNYSEYNGLVLTDYRPLVGEGDFVPKFTVGTNLVLPGVSEPITGTDQTFGDFLLAPGLVHHMYFNELAMFWADPKSPDPSLANSGQLEGIALLQTNPRGFNAYYKNLVTIPHEGTETGIGFTAPSLTNRSVFDNTRNLITGDVGRVDHDFSVANITLEQTFFKGKAGIELAFDTQEYERYSSLPFSGGEKRATGNAGNAVDIAIDVSEWIPVDGSVIRNPNLGRPMMSETNISERHYESERDTARATAFYKLDFTDRDDSLRWLGRHTITGLLSSRTIDTLGLNYRYGVANGGSVTMQNSIRFNNPITNILNATRHIPINVYLGPSLLGNEYQSLSDVTLTQQMDIRLPKDGDIYSAIYWDQPTRLPKEGTFAVRKFIQGGNVERREIDSEVISLQSFLFNDNIVGLVGWRKDTQKSYGRIDASELPASGPDTEAGNYRFVSGDIAGAQRPDSFRLSDDFSKESGDTFTWSLVGHLPWKLPGNTELSVHYAESENFNPVGIRRNARNEIIESPSGDTTEYGFSLSILDGRLHARVNWYETNFNNNIVPGLNPAEISNRIISNANTSNPANIEWEIPGVENPTDAQYFDAWLDYAYEASLGTPQEQPKAVFDEMRNRYGSFEAVREALIATLPPEIIDARNLTQSPDGTYETTDPLVNPTVTDSFSAEGLEIDLTANITPGWRMSLNIAQQETVRSNIAPVYASVLDEVLTNLEAAGLQYYPFNPVSQQVLGNFVEQPITRLLVNPLLAEQANEGQTVQEQREWRVNLVTNYTFLEGKLEGLGLGGAIRWQDASAIGYEIEPVEDAAPGTIRPLLNRPFYGDSETNTDLWVSYRTTLFDGKVGWKIQLNVRNAFADDSFIPVVANPDGRIAVVRNPPTREFFITSTFSF